MPVTSRWAWAYGHLDVTMVIIVTPLVQLQAQLRSGLTPSAQDLTPRGTHPQVIMFGQHSDVRPWFRPPGSGSGYGEWIVATPLLEWTDSHGSRSPWGTMSRLYLDSLWYTMLGWFYAYPKKLARILAPQGSYGVRTVPGSRPRVEMTWKPAGPVSPWNTFPGSTRLAGMFGQPFIDRLGVLPWLGSRMWFDLQSSTVQPVSVSARVYDGAAPGFPAMRIEAGSIDAGLPGAFRLSCDWLLSRPYLAGSMPDLLRGPMPPDDAGASHG